MGYRGPISDLENAVAAYRAHGTLANAARSLGIPINTLHSRIDAAKREKIIVEDAPTKGRRVVDLDNGVVLVGSDAHYWPDEISTAHRAFVSFIKKMKPAVVVMNGDVCDFSGISRHPPIGWTSIPTPAQEIEAAMERMHEIVKASGKAKRYWPLGNHDARLETFIATKTPELKGVKGTSLVDSFPMWEPCWAVFINDRPNGLVVKHRYKGGIHAPWNNTIMSGRSIATGHLHSQKIMPISDYNGTRYGVDVGCLAEPYAPAFQDYLEDSPRNWRSGFAVFTFVKGSMLPPELVHVIEPGVVAFRGQLIEV